MAAMPEIELTPVAAGRLNKPSWHRSHTAALGPVRTADGEHGPINTYDVYLDGERIGSISGSPKLRPERPGSDIMIRARSLRLWTANDLPEGTTQHGTTRFEAVDALVRAHLPAPRVSRPVPQAA
jgi:hypothetical protein